jgi:hypothetical protein
VQTKDRLDNIETRLGDLFEGRVSMTLNATHRVVAPGCATPASMTTATSFHSIPTAPRDGEPLSPLAAAVVRALPDDLDRPAAVKGVDGGFRKRPVRAGVRRPVRASLASRPQRKGDVQPAEGDHRRDPEAAGGRDQHGRGGGRGRADATARSTVPAPATSILIPGA